jgi:hypothetical protein
LTTRHRHDDVARLDVTMYDPSGVSSRQSRSDLIRVFQRLVEAQARRAKQLCQRPPGHELHDDEIVAILGTQLVDLNDIRMVQRGYRPRLALESP